MTNHSDRLNIMQLILNLERAGAQEVVRTLAEYLQDNDCTVTVCTFQDGPVRFDIEELGAKVEILSRPRYSVLFLPMFLAEMRRIRRELARLIETYRIDVAQTHILEVLDFLVLSLRHDTNLRLVLWTMQNAEFLPTHKHWLLKPKRLVYRLLYRLLASRVDGFIAVSEEVRESIIRQIGPIQDKIFTICNAVNLEPFERPGDKAALCNQLGLETHSHLVATVGRLTEQKGHCYLIDAATTVVSAYPDTHFLFIGDGELRDELQQQIQQAGLAANIHSLGIRDDVPHLLAAVDLFVLPSLWEGLSVALLEAMAAGKPIVATAVSGTTQAMTHGQTGLVVPPRDSQALAEAIVQLLSNPAQAQAMGWAAKQHVTMNYSAQKQATEHLALYRQLLDE
jgi:glycosyltransferase involved in cell wall biosynthesis